MPELKLPRLLPAAKEFNIGQDTLIDFLIGKGFSKDDLKPSSKLTEDMYRALQQSFQSDKVARNKADQIEIPKNTPPERRRRDEEEILVFKEQPGTRTAPKPELQPQLQTAEVVAAPPPVTVPEPEIPVIEKAPAEEEPVTEPDIRILAPEIKGPVVVDKIDLSAIDSSTKPRKKTAVTQPEETEAVAEPEVAPVVENIAEEEAEDKEAVIENLKAEKIEGPKIVGKIDLPVQNDAKPKPQQPSQEKDEKRKRKRIPIDKRGGPNNRPDQNGTHSGGGTEQRVRTFPQRDGNQSGGGFNRGGQGGGGQRRPLPIQSKGGQRNFQQPSADKEIDQKEIQEKIRQTQAKLTGASGRGKSLKAKHRRERRHESAEGITEGADSNKLQVTEFVTVSELANLMDVSFADVISKCMSLGIMVSINQRLDAEVIELVAGEFNFEVQFTDLEDAEEEDLDDEEQDPESMQPRAPIVTIMGHVDHGKTSLLDYIRNANVVAGEAGGITQHIGAYEVELSNGRNITFLDTPGHEAFTAMRARGAKVTDIAIIVVAADDAVMPQTKEAISHAQAAGVPMIFAVNKIDKEGANPTKIYEQLSQMNLLVEAWGGKYQNQEISAKQGLNVELLLEKVLLEADLLELKANPDKDAIGTTLEASLDKGRGYVANVLVENGTLQQGDLLVSGQYFGRIKAMFNERNQRITEAPPSTPVQILGLNGAPQAGEKFRVFEDESEAKNVANKRSQIMREQGLRARKHITLDEIGRRLALGNFKELKLIIKGDVDGSVEALSDSLQKLSTPEIAVDVVHKAVGQISENDVLLATASDAIIVGFNVRPSFQANRLAETEGVQIRTYSIIYNAIEEVKSAMEGLLEPTVEEKEIATVEIREVYKFDKATVAGCYVLEGKIKRDSKIRLYRDGILMYPRTEGAYAELGSLKRFKDDVKDVATGYECGLTLKNFTDISVGDTIVGYEEEEVKRTL